jgi:acyl carrier protein
MATILDRLRKVIVEMLGVDEETVVPSASLSYDLNADSSDLAEIIVAVEEEFSTPKQTVVISDEDTEGINTVQDIIDSLPDYLKDD